jgi:hypothetical protein
MDSSLVVVESEMPAFIFDNPAKNLGKNRVFRSLREQAVALQCRKLLDCAPRQV